MNQAEEKVETDNARDERELEETWVDLRFGSMPEQTNGYFNERGGLIWLWAGLLAGPVAWALSQQLAYLLVTLQCSYGRGVSIHPVMLLTLLLAAGGVFASWRAWQRTGSGWPEESGSTVTRARFMAVTGLFLSGFSSLIIIAEWLPSFFYNSCQR